jgi:hypothetical protein
MAIVGRLIRQKQADEAHTARCAAGFKKDYGEYAPVGEMWRKQTRNATIFPTKGCIAHSLLRWRKPDGAMVPWDCGHDGDTLIAPVWALERK